MKAVWRRKPETGSTFLIDGRADCARNRNDEGLIIHREEWKRYKKIKNQMKVNGWRELGYGLVIAVSA